MERTERQIWGALIALMEEKPLDKIKVTELTQRAGISRSTFYSYYDSVYDVLQDIEDDFLSHIVDERKVGVENNASVIAENFSYIRDNLKTFQIITSANGDPSFEMRLGNRSRRVLSNIALETHSSMTKTQLTIIDEFAKAGKLQVLRWWASHKNEISVNEIIDMLDYITDALHGIVTEK